VTAHEGCHEHLILGGELREPRKLEGALDRHVVLGEPDPFDHYGPPASQLAQRLPILGFRRSHV
jgi:hypothetical protein